MVLLRRFCCGCNVRSGSIFCAIYTLVSSAVMVAMMLVRYVGFGYVQTSTVHAVMVYHSLVVYGILSLFAIVLVIGIHLDRGCLLLPWVVGEVCCMVSMTVALCWIDVVQVRMEKDLHTWEICIMAFHLVNMTMSTYCVFCVVSQMQDLKHGRGTLEWYKQLERRRRRHIATGSFAIMIRDVNRHSLEGTSNLGLEPDGVVNPRNSVPELPDYVEEPPPYTTLPRVTNSNGVSRPGLEPTNGGESGIILSPLRAGGAARSPRVVRMRDRTRSPLPEVHHLARTRQGQSMHTQSSPTEQPPEYSTVDRNRAPRVRQPASNLEEPRPPSPVYTSRVMVNIEE